MMTSSSPESKYHDRLNNFPQPGEGRHGALLGAANLGIKSGIDPEQIHTDLRQAANGIPDREIQSAVSKAAADHQQGAFYRPPPKSPIVKDGQAARQRIIDAGTIREGVDLWEGSPIRLYDAPDQDPVLLLQLFTPDDLVFIGDRYDEGVVGQNIRTREAWIGFFQAGGKAGPFIIINPFTGKAAPKKSGDGDTYRGDGSIRAFRHCLVEFDNLTREDQIRFWSAAKLPILALIDSGGKSIHAWLDVQKLSAVSTAAEWDHSIKVGLYQKIFNILGVDRACCNPARLSRLPGYFRSEKGKFQRLLWLSREGRRVCV